MLTFGHGTASEDELVAMLTGAGVTLVVDVRRYPGTPDGLRYDQGG